MTAARTVLAVDVGGSHVKLLTSVEKEPRRFDSGPNFTPRELLDGVHSIGEGWSWDVVSIGIPTPVQGGKVIADPINLGEGWVGFDFEGELGKPTKVVNDAAMQAIGSYEGGRMLFLGLGTGLGSALIDDGVVEPLELGHLPYRKATFEDYVGDRGRERRGKEKWKRSVFDVVARLAAATEPDYVVIGGGAVKYLEELPENSRRGANENAFTGGFRLWEPEWAPRAGVA
jgi:polyphosphate glucokinase